jgi:hypothetical protein
MAFTAIAPAEVAPDQPVSTTLMDKIRTNFDDHEARLSASSGVIGEVLNGSFETAQGGNPNWPDKWTIGQYSGGQVLLDAASTAHGKKSLKMLHTVSGGGGGYAESDYVAMSAVYMPPLNFAYYCTVAAMSIEVWARYYAADSAGEPSTYLGERRIYYNNAGNPMTWSAAQIWNLPLAYGNARYVKYRFIGGTSGTAQTGTVWFDAVGVPIRRVIFPLDNPNPINQPGIFCAGGWSAMGSAFNITIPANFRWLVVRGALFPFTYSDDYGTTYYRCYSRFYLSGIAGKYSTAHSALATGQWSYSVPANTAGGWIWGDMVYDLTGVSAGTYALIFQGASEYSYQYFQSPSALSEAHHDLRSGYISADGTKMVWTDSFAGLPMW